MYGTRLVVWIVGVALVVLAIILLFVETGLSALVPAGIALAGLLLIIGVIVMSIANRSPTHGTTHVRERHVTHEGEPVRETRVIERREPTRETRVIERPGHP